MRFKITFSPKVTAPHICDIIELNDPVLVRKVAVEQFVLIKQLYLRTGDGRGISDVLQVEGDGEVEGVGGLAN